MTIAVLAVQGAFIEHRNILENLGVETFEIRKADDLNKPFDGLILPGGESTVQGKLLKEIGLYDNIKKKIEEGMPVFGTCAGLILLAKNIVNDEKRHFALMDISVVRNGYGRQTGSFNAVEKFGDLGEIPLAFIRAPYIENVGENVEVLCKCDGKIVAAREKNMLVTAFHPEVTECSKVHEYFIEMCK